MISTEEILDIIGRKNTIILVRVILQNGTFHIIQLPKFRNPELALYLRMSNDVFCSTLNDIRAIKQLDKFTIVINLDLLSFLDVIPTVEEVLKQQYKIIHVQACIVATDEICPALDANMIHISDQMYDFDVSFFDKMHLFGVNNKYSDICALNGMLVIFNVLVYVGKTLHVRSSCKFMTSELFNEINESKSPVMPIIDDILHIDMISRFCIVCNSKIHVDNDDDITGLLGILKPKYTEICLVPISRKYAEYLRCVQYAENILLDVIKVNALNMDAINLDAFKKNILNVLVNTLMPEDYANDVFCVVVKHLTEIKLNDYAVGIAKKIAQYIDTNISDVPTSLYDTCTKNTAKVHHAENVKHKKKNKVKNKKKNKVKNKKK